MTFILTSPSLGTLTFDGTTTEQPIFTYSVSDVPTAVAGSFSNGFYRKPKQLIVTAVVSDNIPKDIFQLVNSAKTTISSFLNSKSVDFSQKSRSTEALQYLQSFANSGQIFDITISFGTFYSYQIERVDVLERTADTSTVLYAKITFKEYIMPNSIYITSNNGIVLDNPAQDGITNINMSPQSQRGQVNNTITFN